MVENFTLNKLIQFIYGELPILDRLEVENAIEEDEVLRADYLRLYNAYKEFPKVKFYPKKSTITSILEFNSDIALEAA